MAKYRIVEVQEGFFKVYERGLLWEWYAAIDFRFTSARTAKDWIIEYEAKKNFKKRVIEEL